MPTKRILRICLAVLLLGVLAAIILVFTQARSGTKKLREAREAYLADGGSFDRNQRFAAPVADDENFGAIDALRGITAHDEAGEALRAELELLGLKHETRRLPKARRRKPHEPREKTDLPGYHDYLLETKLLPVHADSTDIASDIYEAFESAFGETVAALTSARDRRSAVFLPLLTEVIDPETLGFTESHPQLHTTQSIARGIKFHSILAIHIGEPELARADIETVFKLADCASADGKSIISHLVSVAVSSMGTQAIWEGLEARVWAEDQLASLQLVLENPELVESLRNGFRAEIVSLEEILGNFKAIGESSDEDPLRAYRTFLSPWIDHNRARILTIYHQGIIAPLGEPPGYLQARVSSETQLGALDGTSKLDPRTMLAKIVMPAASTILKKTAQIHAELAQASTACALERYFIANGSYPESLQDLLPDFASEIPADPIDGNPMRYERGQGSRYRLHSIGWDGDDDGGEEGDIVWSYIEKN